MDNATTPPVITTTLAVTKNYFGGLKLLWRFEEYLSDPQRVEVDKTRGPFMFLANFTRELKRSNRRFIHLDGSWWNFIKTWGAHISHQLCRFLLPRIFNYFKGYIECNRCTHNCSVTVSSSLKDDSAWKSVVQRRSICTRPECIYKIDQGTN